MKYLTEKLEGLGVVFRKAKIENLYEFVKRVKGGGSKYDIIINCSGLGGGKITGNDDDTFPIRG